MRLITVKEEKNRWLERSERGIFYFNYLFLFFKFVSSCYLTGITSKKFPAEKFLNATKKEIHYGSIRHKRQHNRPC